MQILGLAVELPAWAIAEKVRSLGFEADVGTVSRPWGVTTVIRLMRYENSPIDEAISRKECVRSIVRAVEFLAARGGTVHLYLGRGDGDGEPVGLPLRTLARELPRLLDGAKRLVHVV